MARIPFTLESWLKDKSQKVETRDGRSARIICTDAKADDGACIIALITDDGVEEAYQFFPDGRAFSSKSSIEDCADLFIVTPEEESNEIEELLVKFYNDSNSLPHDKDGVYNQHDVDELLHNTAAALFDIVLEELAFRGNIVISIEKFEKCSVEAQEKGRKEALKDLPKWRKWGNGVGGKRGAPLAIVKQGLDSYELVNVLDTSGEQYIMLSDLEKLLKEDEK